MLLEKAELKAVDREIFDAIEMEKQRQQSNLEMIASENHTSVAVMEAMGSVMTNKYAEGYPAHRYYGGCQYVDIAESLAIERAKKLFGAGNGFQNVFYPKKKGEYRMDITSCPYCRTFTELGCPELTKIFCENDERIYGRLPGLKFERTGTLGKGAERCDFCLRKV